jgi:hypothetical protein
MAGWLAGWLGLRGSLENLVTAKSQTRYESSLFLLELHTYMVGLV